MLSTRSGRAGMSWDRDVHLPPLLQSFSGGMH
jgi:hypothetical protein